jgi:hypothetical protein
MPVSVHDLIDVGPTGALVVMTTALADDKQCVIFLGHGTPKTISGLCHDDLAVLHNTKDMVWLHCCHAGQELISTLAQAWNKCVVGFTGKVVCVPYPFRTAMMTLLRDSAMDVLPHVATADLEERLRTALQDRGQAVIDQDKDLTAGCAVIQSAVRLKVARA